MRKNYTIAIIIAAIGLGVMIEKYLDPRYQFMTFQGSLLRIDKNGNVQEYLGRWSPYR